MTPMKKLLTASSLLAVAGLVACGGGGGGSSPAPTPTATGLAYTDPNPTSGTFLLKKDTTLSSGSHLVLDLVGPATGTASGVTLTLNADTTKVAWTNVAATDPANTLVQNGLQFVLGSGTPILLARTYGTTTLMATVAQKGLAVSPALLNGVLLKVALDLKPNLGLAQGTTIQLSADSTKSLVLDGTKGTPIGPITVSVGTLTAQ